MALDLTDQTANGNNLTNVNICTDVTSNLPFAQSSHAAGLASASSQYLYAGDSASLSITGDLTFELLVKFTSLPTGGNAWFFSKSRDDGVNDRSYYFGITDVGSGNFNLRFIISPNGQYSAGDDEVVLWTAPSTGVWYHLAVTWKASTKAVKFYLNGSQQGSDQATTAGAILDNALPMSIGCTNAGGTPAGFLDGIVDEARIWNVVRTITEINDNKLNELTGLETGLNAYWPFETLGVTLGGEYSYFL